MRSVGVRLFRVFRGSYFRKKKAIHELHETHELHEIT